MKGEPFMGPVPPTYYLEGDIVMGGKPSKGTKKDKRLKENKPKPRKRVPRWLRRSR